MRYLLDTNIVSYWMRGDVLIINSLREKRPCDLCISTITVAEIMFGIEKSPHRKQERSKKLSLIRSSIEVIPFDEGAGEAYATTRSNLEKRDCSISERDLQIASIALSRKLCLVTHNVSEFSRIQQLEWEDWNK